MVSRIFSAVSFHGAVFASEEARRALRASGLGEVGGVYRRCASARERHRGRAVAEVSLSGGDDGRRVFVKMQWGRRRLWLRMNEIRSGQVFQSMPVREWHGLQRLRACGVCVPEPLALYRQGVWSIRDAIVVSPVPVAFSVHELIQNGQLEQMRREAREGVLEAVVCAMQRIHAAGLGWRGVSSKHVYPERTEDGSWRVWLIDCEGVHRGAGPKIVRRDFRKLQRSLWESGADARTVERCCGDRATGRRGGVRSAWCR